MTFSDPKVEELHLTIRPAIIMAYWKTVWAFEGKICQAVLIRSQNRSVHIFNYSGEIQFLEQFKTKWLMQQKIKTPWILGWNIYRQIVQIYLGHISEKNNAQRQTY